MPITIVGTGDHRYRVHPNWARLPSDASFGIVSAVAVDARDRLLVYARGAMPITVFDHSGAFLGSWGADTILDAHGIHATSDGFVWVTDRDAHEVIKFDLEGRPVLRLGTRDRASWQAPFNHPAGVAVASDGDVYVSDGYANAAVHRFASDGTLKGSWGEPGDAVGAFKTPHDVWVAASDRVYVCDRDNNRVQVFDRDGTFREAWTDFFKPTSVVVDDEGFVYVTDLVSRVSILTEDGALVSRLRIMMDGGHSIWVDRSGDLFIAEIHVGRVDRFERLR